MGAGRSRAPVTRYPLPPMGSIADRLAALPTRLPLTLARCPVNTYRLLITGPRTGRRVDTVPAASLQAAVAMLQQQARLFDSAAEVAPLHDPCPFG
jgi:hypothetical protein